MANPQIVRGTTGMLTTMSGSVFSQTQLFPSGSWNGAGLTSGAAAFDTYTTNPGSSADGWGVSITLSNGLTSITVPLSAVAGANYTIGVSEGGSPSYFPFDVIDPPGTMTPSMTESYLF